MPLIRSAGKPTATPMMPAAMPPTISAAANGTPNFCVRIAEA